MQWYLNADLKVDEEVVYWCGDEVSQSMGEIGFGSTHSFRCWDIQISIKRITSCL